MKERWEMGANAGIVKRSFGFALRRTLFTDVVQGAIAGGVLAFFTANLLINTEVKAMQRKVEGWSTTFQPGVHQNGILRRAAMAKYIPAANLPEEAVYWTAKVDGVGHALNGQHDYVLHFPPGGLPPNNAFWSVTMTDPQRRMVDNPIHRYTVGDRSALMPGADGSVDIFLQNGAPAGHESNWLPTPPGDFMLWLRVYLPSAAILNGQYNVPPVVEVRTKP
jgi:hypothetical protein